MEKLDEQEKSIARQLVRDPRASDKSISDSTGVQLRTVGRKRHKLEQSGLLRYWASVDLSETGTGEFIARHLYIIKFAIGVTFESVRNKVLAEPEIAGLTNMVVESQIAEVDGKLALLFVIEGASDRDIVKNVDERLIPSLLRNHGANSIAEINTLRLLSPVRVLRNYLPMRNMKGSTMSPDWPDNAIYVGR